MKKILSTAFLILAFSLSACGGGKSENSGAGKALTGEMGANLPLGVPLIAGGNVEINNNGKNGPKQTNAAAVLTSTEPVKDVYKFYAKAFQDAGYKKEREIKVDDILTITGHNGKSRGMITVKPEGGKTKIMIVRNDEH